MPAVMTKRNPIQVVISEDENLIDHDEDGANYVFTDISMSKDAMVNWFFFEIDFLSVILYGERVSRGVKNVNFRGYLSRMVNLILFT